MAEKIPQPEINILLTPPRRVTSVELKNAERSHTSTFGLGPKQNNERSYKLAFHNGQAGIDVKFYAKLPDTLTEEQRNLFIASEQLIDDSKTKIYSYSIGDLGAAESDSTHESPSGEYLIAQPRILEDQEPQEIEKKQLANLLKTKKVLFYTGAGISAAKGLSMENMLNSIGIKNEPVFQKTILEKPEQILDAIKGFHKIAFESAPTAAHVALAKMSLKIRSQILTENFDFLQERAGVEPFHMSGPRIKTEIRPEWLKKIEAIICIGLSRDDRGFLAWYKDFNPNGKIIAIDQNPPKYLGAEDYFFQGDLQQIVPELAQKLD